MDFLDPKKQKRHQLILFVGYALVALAIGIATLILYYQARGYGINQNGQVIQNGLVFVSSQPRGADIYLNNARYKAQTNTRLLLPSGSYDLKIAAAGYRDWQRPVTVQGDDVQHFDYPFLFPQNLTTTAVGAPLATPVFTSQSPDKRWLVVQPGVGADFVLYDLKNSDKPTSTAISLPAAAYTAASTAQTWAAVSWADDNRHLLLRHTYTPVNAAETTEYIVFDRQAPEESQNVTTTLQLAGNVEVSLFNQKYDEYYVFDRAAGTLRTVSLGGSLTEQNLEHVVAYKGYGASSLLYITSVPPTGAAQENTVSVVLQEGQKTYTLRTLPAGAPSYNLDIARYSGDWYVLVAASTGRGAYIYRNPQTSRTANGGEYPLPWRLLTLTNVTHVSFSANAQYLLAESGQQFVVYDAENFRTYRYTIDHALDAPQTYASWMDGNRLLYTSGGKLVVFDYDAHNQQVLQPLLPQYKPAFDARYESLYSFMQAPDDPTHVVLNQTLLRVPTK